MSTLTRWLRNATCRHTSIQVKASTAVEAAPWGSGHGGNGVVGVTVRCKRCDQVWVADVYAAVAPSAAALVALLKIDAPAPQPEKKEGTT